jgi:GMP synthase (glutamine-hydrolysing)
LTGCHRSAFQTARKAVIFSGGPASVPDEGSPRAPQAVFDPACRSSPSATASRRCAMQIGGKVEGGPTTANSAAPDVEILKNSRPLFEGFWTSARNTRSG